MSPTIITLYDRLIFFPLYNQARRIFFFKLRPHLSENLDTPPPQKKILFVNPYLSVGGGTSKTSILMLHLLISL